MRKNEKFGDIRDELLILRVTDLICEKCRNLMRADVGLVGDFVGNDYYWLLEREEGGLIFYGRMNSYIDLRTICVSVPDNGEGLNISRWRDLPDDSREYDTPIEVDLRPPKNVRFGVEKGDPRALTRFDVKYLLGDLREGLADFELVVLASSWEK